MSLDVQLDNLAKEVLKGRVVFFIGAGFSIDSENNSTSRLILRLLLRFEAMCRCLDGQKLLDRLCCLFNLKKDVLKGTVCTDHNLKILSGAYYQINDWMCCAFAELLAGKKPHDPEKVRTDFDPTKIHKMEESLQEECKFEPLQPLQEINEKIKKMKPRDAGKALFLDTMGFQDDSVMGGEPEHAHWKDIGNSYHHKLFPRYHVLARLARESLSNVLVTTNYDLLLEGGYRLAGFEYEKDDHLNRLFAVIDGAVPFSRMGAGHKCALIFKIHGCVGAYRRKAKKKKTWKAHLPNMVFTFREIQNWRKDAWSRDLMRTLLRTRTMAFSGYSAQDPVIHDTCRSVYEEMKNRFNAPPAPKVKGGKNAEEPTTPAFFMGLTGDYEFHGMEILRAASETAGVYLPTLKDHPNYLHFQKRGKSKFPNLDELYLWLFHLVFRDLQKKALASDLSLLVHTILKGKFPEAGLKSIIKRFEVLCTDDNKSLKKKALDTKNRKQFHKTLGWSRYRKQFHKTIGWSWYFAAGLMREWTKGEQILRQSGPPSFSLGFDPLHYYRPIHDRPDWAAWSAVVELALRNLFPESYMMPDAFPVVALVDKVNAAPRWLSLSFSMFQRNSSAAAPRGAPFGRIPWPLCLDQLPWPAEDKDLPTARELLDWANAQNLKEGRAWIKSLKSSRL